MTLILPTNSIKSSGFDVANSCRFNHDDSPVLKRTHGTPTNSKKFVWSGWLKRSKLGDDQYFAMHYQSSSEYGYFYLRTGDDIRFFDRHGTGDGTDTVWVSNTKFRDISAWYSIIIKVDTTQSTDSDRFKVYINGTQDTGNGITYPALNADMAFNKSSASNRISIGGSGDGYNHMGGYFSEIVFIDGTSPAHTEFGEFSEDSPTIWMPKDVSGLTFGDNGYYLDFEDSANLGNDANGGTDFTETNITATDQSLDTCTNNHAVGNPLLNYNPVLSEGNLVLTSSGTAWKNSMSTIGVSSGIWYHEVKITAESGVPYQLIGVTDSYHPHTWGASPPNYLGIGALQVGYYNDNGTYYKADGQVSYSGNGFGINDTIGVLLDLNAGTPTIKFYKNDADQGSINLPTSSNSTGLWFFMQSMYISTCSVNYGSPAHAISSGNQDGNGYGNFEFATKGGYTLNTKNLAEYG